MSPKDYLLRNVLGNMQKIDNKNFCLREPVILDYLEDQVTKMQRGPHLDTKVRAEANLICRYALPLMQQQEWTRLSNLFAIENKDILIGRMKEFSGLDEFLNDPDAFGAAIRERRVSFFILIFGGTNKTAINYAERRVDHQLCQSHLSHPEEAVRNGPGLSHKE